MIKTPLQILLEEIPEKVNERMRLRAGLSFFNADILERKRRLKWTIRFSKEYERVLAIDPFGTALMLSDMEQVIEGDIFSLRKTYRFWAYDDDPRIKDRYGALHAPWMKLLEEYLLESEAIYGGLGEA